MAGVPAHEVVERLRAGDHAALTLVYRSLFEGLWRYAVLHTRTPSVAMDVVQDVFLSLWLKRDTLHPDTDLGVFLAVAVRHNAINRSKRGRVGDRMAAAVAAEYVEMPGRSQEALAADARVEVDEFMAAYHRAVGTLTEREQAAAFLRWEEGWTFERIGEALGMSNVGARKLLLRAQTKVQALLAPFRR
jgi:RNA polymerase sigma-70 factor (ECF subfamily)